MHAHGGPEWPKPKPTPVPIGRDTDKVQQDDGTPQGPHILRNKDVALGHASARRARAGHLFWPCRAPKGCSEAAWRQSSACLREYLNDVLQELHWADTLDPFSHCPHFLFFMTHLTGSMPISSIGGMWCADLWNSKNALHVYKVIVAFDMPG